MSEIRYRYPGINYFTCNDQDIFCGRSEDAQRLLNRIMISNTLVLHGESGTGKSSLVQAGLLPLLASQNREQLRKEIKARERLGIEESNSLEQPMGKEILSYIPVTIRLDEVKKEGDAVHNRGILLLQHTLERLRANEEKMAKELPIIPAQENSLWYTAKLFERNKYTLLLIFDQFEELQAYTHDEIKAFKTQIADLFVTPMPEEVYELYEEKTATLSAQEMNKDERAGFSNAIHFLEKPLRVKILFVVREDKLGTMSLLADYFPDILKNDFLLLPLTRENAKRAIAEPAKQKGDFFSTPFDFDPLALNYLLENLVDAGSGLYDPIQLQIVCSNIERKIAPYDQLIEKDDIPDVGDIILDFYTDVWKPVQVNTNPDTFNTMRKRIIEKLVVGGKRNLVHENLLIENNNPKDRDVIVHLVKEGLLKKIPSGGDVFYQLTHDRMIQPLLADLMELEAREKERKRMEEDIRQGELAKATKRKWQWTIAACLLLAAVVIVIILAMNFNKLKREALEEKYLVTSTMLKLERNPTMSYLIARDWYNKHPYGKRIERYLNAFDTGKYIFLSGVYPSLSNVTFAELSDDKKSLVLNGTENRTIWDLEKGIPKWEKMPPVENGRNFSSRDEKMIMSSSGRLEFFDDGDSVDVRTSSDSSIAKVPSEGYGFDNGDAVAISADLLYLVFAESIFNTKTKKKLGVLPSFTIRGNKEEGTKDERYSPTAISFLHDSKRLIIGYSSGDILLFRIDEKSRQKLLPIDTLLTTQDDYLSTGKSPVTALLADTSDTYLFSAHKTGNVRVLNLATSPKLKGGTEFRGGSSSRPAGELKQSGPVNSLAISSDNKLLLAGGNDGAISVWAIPKMELLSVLKWSKAPEIRSVSFSTGDKDIIAIAGDDITMHWKIEAPKQLYDNSQLYRFSPFDYAVLNLDQDEYHRSSDTTSTESLYRFTLNYLMNIPANNEFREESAFTNFIRQASAEVKYLFRRLQQRNDYRQTISAPAEVLLEMYYYNFLGNEPMLLQSVDSLDVLTYRKLKALSHTGNWKRYFLDSTESGYEYTLRFKVLSELNDHAAAFLEEENKYEDGFKYLLFYRDAVLTPLKEQHPKNHIVTRGLESINAHLFRYYLYTGNYKQAKNSLDSIFTYNKMFKPLYLAAVELAADNYLAASEQIKKFLKTAPSSWLIYYLQPILYKLENKNIAVENIQRLRKEFKLKNDFDLIE